MFNEFNISDQIEPFYKEESFFEIHINNKHALFEEHNHNYLQILYLLNGSFPHKINGHTFTHREGQLLFLSPYIPHEMDTRDCEDFEWIAISVADNFLNLFPQGMTKNTIFNLTCLRPLMYNAGESEPFLTFSPDTRTKLEAIFFGMLEEYDNFSELSPIYLRADLVRLLSLIAEEYTKNIPRQDDEVYSRYRSSLRNALDYINSNYTKQITRKEICNIAYMSSTPFSYVFRQLTGRTFIEYQHLLRIRLAKKLLRKTDKTITDIYLECGFSNATHFCRVFKKIVGYSPTQFILLERADGSENQA